MAYFDNPIDHWNYQNLSKTYRQRYWYDQQYCTLDDKYDCPIFVYFCGEYECEVPDFRMFPFMIGAELGATLLVLEHRYYGRS